MDADLLVAVKELALHVRTRLESAGSRGAQVERPTIEVLIVLQKAVESAETGDPAVAARMIDLASELLLETPLFAEERNLLDRWMERIDPERTPRDDD